MSLRTTQTDSVPLSWHVRDHVSIFLRCLHLLDLDKLNDWPNITSQLFTAKAAQQNLQLRVKAVEWSLYRLLEIFDPSEAKDKLRPFFPPIAPLQSINLRAALYRCLSELKKTGVLGKEILLRKTMLDDCKGEKFEEMIAVFAMIVLRKAVQQRGGSSAALSRPKLPEAQLLPLVLAHQKILQKNIQTRNQLSQQHQQHLHRLKAAEKELAFRKAEAESKVVDVDLLLSRDLEILVNANWTGDGSWTDVLLHGRPIQTLDFDPVSPTLTRSEELEKTPEKPSTAQRLVGDLDVRIRMHQDRLAEWKSIAKDLYQSKGPEPVAVYTSSREQETTQSRFTKHISLSSWVPAEAPQSHLAPEYERLLSTMRQELAGRKKANRSLQQIPNDKPSFSKEAADKIPRTPVQNQAKSNRIAVTPPDTSCDPQIVTPEQDQEFDTEPLSVERFLPTSSPVSSIDESSSSTWIPEQRSSVTAVQSRSPERQSMSTRQPHEADSVLPPCTPASPSKEWMSLVDRTRASMSMFGSYKQPLELDAHEERSDEIQPSISENNPPLSKTPPISTHEDRRSTLLERTRQSMSMISNPKPRSGKSRTSNIKSSHRSSQIFPINQFETPARNKSPKQVEWGPDSQSSTPRDKLFDEEAEYASVFKSRPKIAMSPALSPERSAIVFDSILEQDVEGFGDSEEDDRMRI